MKDYKISKCDTDDELNKDDAYQTEEEEILPEPSLDNLALISKELRFVII